MPDSKTENTNQHELASLAELCQDLLPDIVRHICHQLHRYPTPDNVEDYVRDMLLYLLAEDYHYLKIYDPEKGTLKTWLNTVTKNELLHKFRHERAWDSLDEILIEQLLELPQQERNVITQEQREAVARAVAKLSARKQQLYALLCEGFSATEFAQHMNIKAASVHQRRYELIRLIQAGLKNGGGKSRARACEKKNEKKRKK